MKHRSAKEKKLLNINILLGIFIFFSVSVLIGYKAYSIRNHEVPLSEQNWSTNPSLVAVNYTSSTDSALIVYRITDGTPEPVSGTWKYAFTAPTHVYMFGSFPQDTNSQRLYFLTDRGAIQKDVSKLSGPILNIQENPKETYLLISGIDQGNGTSTTSSTEPVSFYTCVAEKLTPAPYPCRMVLGDILPNYDTSTLHHSFWNTANDRELIIKELGGQHRLYAFDPWEEHPVEIKAEDRTDIKSEIDSPIVNYKFHQFLNILTIEKSPKNKRYYFVPLGSTFYWVDQYHIIVRKDTKIYLLDTRTQLKTWLPDLPDNNATVETYYSPKQN